MKNKILLTISFVFCATAFSFNYFLQQKKQPQKKSQPPVAFSKYWLTVDSLEKKGLNKSALETVMKVYKKSLDEQNLPQLIKAIIHRMKFESFTEEDAVRKSIAALKGDIEKTPFPASAILHSMLAETYWNYYEQNRWKFMNRTQTADFSNDDISTWDLKKILEQTVSEYRRSLDSSSKEKKIQVNVFDEIIQKGNTDEARRFRPTLYDFLAQRALDFYMNEEPGLTEAVNKYKIDAAWYLSDVDMFLNFGLQTEDSLNLRYNAILILQNLLRFHLDDAHPGALIDANLKRLKFVYNELPIANKDSLYTGILSQIANRYRDYPGSSDALYEIATVYNRIGGEYKAGEKDEVRLLKKKAEAFCDSAIERFPYSQGGLNAKHLKGEINQKFFSFQAEEVNIPEQPLLGNLKYANLNKIFARIVRIKSEIDESLSALYGERLIRYFIGQPVVKEWSVDLPDDGDKQVHSTEIEIPALPTGRYAILISANESFSVNKNSVSHVIISVSNLSAAKRLAKNGNYDYFVLNRNSGLPVEGARVIQYFSAYNYLSRSYELKKGETFTTNTDGYVNIQGHDSQQSFDLEIESGNDKLFMNENLYPYHFDNEKKTSIATYFFTDRAIYRPGQTVYFKGIVLDSDGEASNIKTNFQTTVGLYDVNSQKVSEQVFKSNDYGTFNGSFVAPQGVLTGMMRLQNENGVQYFSVEEYKRPKFEVTFEPMTGSYLLNNRITATIKTASYSGTNITGAKVSYHVVRTSGLPVWMFAGRGYLPQSGRTEITSGTAVTDDLGFANITFDAVADQKISRESDPIFIFEITADVTDLNGETHSATEHLSVSYKALSLETDLESELPRNAEKSMLIISRNMAGSFEPADGKISIHRLEQPARLLRKRLWDFADRHTLTREEFEKKFPNDIFENEDQPDKWPRLEEVLHADFNTAKDSTIRLDGFEKWRQGKYILELFSKDRYGQDVHTKQFFTVYDSKEKECALNSFGYSFTTKTRYEPGDHAQFVIGSHEKDLRILYEVENKGKIIQKQWMTLNNEQRLIDIPVEETMRGNFGVHFSFVSRNRYYHFDHVLNVPWSNKEINISLETFRDKLTPGSKEEWRVKLKGKFADQVAAEMVAEMYDASLDAFASHHWNMDVWPQYGMTAILQPAFGFGALTSASVSKDWNQIPPQSFRKYDALNWFGYIPSGYRYYRDGNDERRESMAMQSSAAAGPKMMKEEESSDRNGNPPYEEISDSSGVGKQVTGKTSQPLKMRTNFSETAFFYPTLTTNEKSEVVFSFTVPDALTRWKFMALAHTKKLEVGLFSHEVVTQKDLMVVPNAPRFLREGDTISFPSKITNLTDTLISGVAKLLLFDALNNQNITQNLLGKDSLISFTADKKGNTNVQWNLSVPEGISAIKYLITAVSEKFSDGEEQVIPVLTNRMLVTESLPLWANSNQTKKFSLHKLLGNGSSTLRNHKLTLEYTSNPAWYAVQALPYMMEYPYECAEQVFSRYYANALAAHIANSNPKIKQVFNAWKTQSPESFLSSLEKNRELKLVLLEQTPWVMDAKNESERKKRIALLFDLNKMSDDLQNALLKLQKKQNPGGSWSWFDGMPDDRYITQYIVEGIGHLGRLGVASVKNDERIQSMMQNAIAYLDRMMNEDYRKLVNSKADLNGNNLSSIEIHYLYARSFFKDIQIQTSYQKAFDYYLSLEKKYWLVNNEYLEGMMALTLARNNQKDISMDVIKSLKENSQYSEELGRYWKKNTGGYYWAQASIETQSLLVEAFSEITGERQAVDEMQRWLLKNKQTSDWKTTKATAEACYALLLGGTDFLAESAPAEITVGSKKIDPASDPDLKAEAGTGYFKTSWSGNEIKPEMGEVTVTNKNNVPGYGALYWQYFEQLDKITPHESPLKLSKQLFIESNSSTGKIIRPVQNGEGVNIGDHLKVRVELRVDRDMEYVMMKDMRASGLEPVNVLSSYKWQDGLGYYESTHDASTDFFFSYLPKGVYVFEYPLMASQQGNFSNGITEVQCMYAPEFGAHSEGIRLTIGR